MRLEELRPPQIRQAVDAGVPALLPVGVIEAHGHHLPVGTDAILAADCALQAAELIPLVVAPPLWYGPSTYDVGSPDMGSLEVPFAAFAAYVEAVLRSLVRVGFRQVFVLCHHQGRGGEEGQACAVAAQRIWSETGRAALGEGWWGRLTPAEQAAQGIPAIHVITTFDGLEDQPEPIRGDHAGFWETSFMAGLRPHLVDLGELRRADRPWYATREHPAVEDATAAGGAAMVRRMVEGLVRVVCRESGRPLPAGLADPRRACPR